MTSSIYQLALGSQFRRLQPELQEYFSLHQDSGSYGLGEGLFSVAGSPSPILRPVFAALKDENTFFPEHENDVPFTIRNWAHRDPYGRASLTARRELRFSSVTRVFEDTTSWASNGLVDYLGVHRRVATALTCTVTAEGRLRMISDRTRLFLGPARLPIPDRVGAQAYVEQWWDDAEGRFRISSNVIHRQLGTVLVYAGWFTYRFVDYDGGVPDEAIPARWERRV